MKIPIVGIMTQGILSVSGFASNLLLVAAAIALITEPTSSGLGRPTPDQVQSEQTAPKLAYDVVSLKPLKTLRDQGGIRLTPDGLIWQGALMKAIIASAYGVRVDRISGLPTWASSGVYDLQVKMGDETLAEFQKLPQKAQQAQRFQMLRPVLEERLKLKAHLESKIVTVYSLVIAKGGFKLKEADPNNTYEDGIKVPEGTPRAGSMSMTSGKLRGQAITITMLTAQLGGIVDGPVHDDTGLTGKYDVTLEWSPAHANPDPDDTRPSIFTALQEQLGLKLEPGKGPVDVLIIDHIEKPTEN